MPQRYAYKGACGMPVLRRLLRHYRLLPHGTLRRFTALLYTGEPLATILARWRGMFPREATGRATRIILWQTKRRPLGSAQSPYSVLSTQPAIRFLLWRDFFWDPARVRKGYPRQLNRFPHPKIFFDARQTLLFRC